MISMYNSSQICEMPDQCRLLLDNYTGQYLAGSPIQGRIILNLDSDITLRGKFAQKRFSKVIKKNIPFLFLGVRITLSCNEHTEWIGTESYYDSDAKEHRSRDTQFTGDKEVLSIKQWLYGDRK